MRELHSRQPESLRTVPKECAISGNGPDLNKIPTELVDPWHCRLVRLAAPVKRMRCSKHFRNCTVRKSGNNRMKSSSLPMTMCLEHKIPTYNSIIFSILRPDRGLDTRGRMGLRRVTFQDTLPIARSCADLRAPYVSQLLTWHSILRLALTVKRPCQHLFRSFIF